MPETPITSDARKGPWLRLRRFLFAPSTRYSLFTLLAAGLVVGIAAAFGFDYALHATSTNEFCGSCHANDAAKEWRASVHYNNRAGLVAGCSDCHMPREFWPKMVREIKALQETWSHFTGVINTPEKYEARRRAMDESEWSRLRGNGAQECRNCHHPDSMFNKDKIHVGAMHKSALASGQICIDCHKGVGHRAPGQAAAPSGR
jgi:cytochrome c-type protein NapC